MLRALLVLVLLAVGTISRAESPPLTIETKIPLGNVLGRIDHLAIDLARERLYVAELDNDSVGVIDLRQQKVIQRLTGLREPQGIGYSLAADTVYVATGGDGAIHAFKGPELNAAGVITLGGDADNVRVDDTMQRVVVGYGNGALAIVDTTTLRKMGDVQLKGHPESFQLDTIHHRIFANVPDAHVITVVDSHELRTKAFWSTKDMASNYPLALDSDTQRVLAVFRRPAALGVFDMKDGTRVATVPTCGDADDVFFDSKRSLVYVSCGDGMVDVIRANANTYTSIAHVATGAGARTSLFVPELERLYVAVRAGGGESAAIWVLRPSP